MNRYRFCCLILGSFSFLLLSNTAFGALLGDKGGISFNHTRVIYNASDKLQTLTVKNRSDKAWLIQSLVVTSSQDNKPAPFLITPPLYRLEAGTEQTLRILSQGIALAEDKESVFYLSIQAILASQQQSAAVQQTAVSMRFNLKMFYRPADVGEPSVNASCLLRFSQNNRQIRVENPSRWHVTLRTLTFDGKPHNLDAQPMMLAPHSVQLIAGSGNHVRWQAVNDFGSLHPVCQSAIRPSTES